MKTAKSNKLTIHFAQLLVLVLTPLTLRGCGSAAKDEAGRCKAVKASDYVASQTDTDGKPWKFEIRPSGSLEIKCYDTESRGTIYFVGIIKDSLGAAKAGLVTRPDLGGASTTGDAANQVVSLGVDLKNSDVNTDACGVVSYVVNWRCPAPKKKNSGQFYASSGPLVSEVTGINIEHVVEEVTSSRLAK